MDSDPPPHPGRSSYDHPGYSYVCMLQSDYTTWAMLEIHYEPDDAIPHQVEFGHKVGSVEFDRVPEIFPNAEPVDIDGQDGRGWAWAVNNTAYVFWLYPDGQSLSMFLCKRVRSEMGVDSVGVGGGEPGGPAGGALRLVVTRPVDESTRWPCASGRACSSPWRAPRPGGPRCCRPAGHSSSGRRLVGGDSGRASRRTARFGGWATRTALVVQR